MQAFNWEWVSNMYFNYNAWVIFKVIGNNQPPEDIEDEAEEMRKLLEAEALGDLYLPLRRKHITSDVIRSGDFWKLTWKQLNALELKHDEQLRIENVQLKYQNNIGKIVLGVIDFRSSCAKYIIG